MGYANKALEQGLPIGPRELRLHGPTWQNLAAESQRLLPVAVGKQTEVADPHEAVRQDVQEESAKNSWPEIPISRLRFPAA